jgi:hypothetical protein
MPEKPFWEKETLFVTTLIVTCLILFFFGLGTVPIKDIDEAMHARNLYSPLIPGRIHAGGCSLV